MTIKELRESKGLSQGKFADSIGIGRTAIVGYEKGKFKWNMKKRTVLAALFLLFTLFAFDCAAQAETSENALKEGLAWYYGTETGTADFDKAEAAFRDATDAGVADAWT